MILFISEVKKLLRKYLPNKIYFGVYGLFKKAKGEQFLQWKQKKQLYFVKKRAYEFELQDIHFPIILDPDNGGVDSEIYADGAYEPGILKIIRNTLKRDSIFVDVGANIGQHSLFASLFAKHVYAFEPIEKIYKQFLESVTVNDFTNINIYNYALGNEEKTLPIFGNVGNMGASSLVTSENRKKIQDIQVFRFDDVRENIGIHTIDFIKIDVEGYELDVLFGAEKSIMMCKPIIMIEFSPYFYNQIDVTISKKIIEWIIDMGYIIYDIGDGSTQRNIISKDSDVGSIVQTNFLCINKKN